MQDFAAFINSITTEFTPVIDASYSKEQYTAIDLSQNNPELLRLEVASSEAFAVFIEEYLKNQQAKAAFGGYNELRTLYNRSELFSNPENNRNIHIGLDVWVPAGTDIISPLDGQIHSFKDNDNFGDYGPTIILEHMFSDIQFFSLYGHLSKVSLEKLEVGTSVKKGQKIATLGDFSENGDYAPHLHFQIMKDLENVAGDYPGVVRPQDLDHYLSNCPDPNLLLKIPTTSS